MARRIAWSDVRGGLVASVAIAVLAVVILKYSRVGALHGDTFPLHAMVGEARGVLTGSEVWLSGQKIGKITDIRFLPPSTDSTSRIAIDMEILEEYRSAMRRDAVAQIQNGGSPIGAPVVYLSPGTLRAIIGNVKVLTAQLQATQGTLGALLNSPGAGELGKARLQTMQLMTRLRSGPGTIGRVMQGGLTARTQRVMARVDSVRALLASPAGGYGRFRRDSTLLREVADVRNELSIVRAELDEPRGTAGRVLRDSALVNAVGQAERELSLLIADLKKHPLRYIAF
jgi:phospholipid/cholesterol/gamma-HCH transport system substrate-binding protein